MAQLQGHFLRYKHSAADALENVQALIPRIPVALDASPRLSRVEVSSEVEVDGERARREAAFKRAQRGPISVHEVDRMVFNPQPGWDKDIQ